MTNYIALAIPVFFLMIGIELVVAKVQGKKYYRLSDAINNLSCGMLQRVVVVFVAGFIFLGYLWVFEKGRLFAMPSSVWTWVGCFVLVDFCYYWFHRLSHEINFLWAAHVVHHQSEEYNLAVALRQSSLQPIFGACFYWPLALLGFPPLVFATCSSFHTLYQFWIHTRTVKRLGPLEHVLMTPSHHRVHHGRNPIYIDRNHGGTFIIWDKLFGTFQREEEEVLFGVTKPLASWNPVWANLDYWADLFASARRAETFSDKLKVFLKPPGWFPKNQGGFQQPPEITGNEIKYHIPAPLVVNSYAFFQFLIIILGVTGFIFFNETWTPTTRLGCAGLVVWSLLNLGGLFEARYGFFLSELARLATLPVLLALLFPEIPSLGVGMATLSLPAVWWLIRGRAFFKYTGSPHRMTV